MPIKKILLIRFSSIGDIILTTPLIGSLKNYFKDNYQIDYLTKDRYAELLQGQTAIKEVFRLVPGFHNLLKMLSLIRNRKYTIVIDLHRSLRSRFLFFFCPATIKIKCAKSYLGKYILLFLKMSPLGSPHHQTHRYYNTLQKHNLNLIPQSPKLYPSPQNFERTKQWLRAMTQPIITLSPSAKWQTKRWPDFYFSTLAQKIVELFHAHIFLIGGVEDQTLCHKIQQGAGKYVTNLAGQLSLLESVALLSYSRLLISNDSAAVHMAESIPIPVILILGPTVKEFGFFPLHPRSIILEETLPCRPCSSHGGNHCPIGTHDCMLRLTPERVLRSMQTLLTQN